MLQPFEKFIATYIERLISLKKFYLVSQTYSRAKDHFADETKSNILLTDYDDLGLAKIHLNAVKHDKYASIIDLKNEKHKEKIKSMLQPGSAYELYWSVVKDVKQMQERLNNRYTENMRRYITKATNWRISADENITPKFEVTFGELFITLKRRSQTLRVKFEEIEKA
jgi:hypothetical protein